MNSVMKKLLNKSGIGSALWGLIIIASLGWATGATAQTTLYSETFTYANGTTTGTGDPAKWTRDLNGRTPTIFQVQSNVFEAENTGGEVIWNSQLIYIQDWQYVNVSVDMPINIDNMEADDYINFYYKLNGGAETLFSINGTNTGNFSAGRMASHSGLNGNTLQIVVRIKNNASNEDHFFDNVTVTGYPYVYFEDFNTYANGTNTSSKWTLSGTAKTLSVQNGEFQYRNSAQPAYWLSSVVDISAHSSVNLSVVLRENSDAKLESSDYIEVLYKLNGGAETRFATNGYFQDDFASPYTFTASQTGLSGSTVQILVKLKSNADDEYYFFDDVIISSNNAPASLSVSSSKTNVLCYGASTGAVNITNITGGRAPFTFSWSNGATTQNISNVAAGTYTVTVTGITGLTATTSQTITQPAAGYNLTPTYSNYNGAHITCNGAANGSVSVNVTGNTSPYTYAWSTGATTNNITGRAAGVYTLTVTDNNGCTSTTSATITQPAAVSGSIVKTDISCIGQTNGTATLTPSGGITPYTYSWTGGVTTQNRTGLATGTYNVTITDINGCTGTTSTTLTNPSAMSVSVTSSTNILCHGNSTGAINITAAGGTAPLTFAWSNGATTEDLTNLAIGTYTVTVTANGNIGCTVTTSSTLTQPAAALTINETINHISCNNYNDGNITLSPSGGTGTKTYAWTGGSTTSSRTSLSAGTYSYTVTDANSCTASNSIIITNPDALSLSMSVTGQTNENSPNGAIDLTVSGGWTPYTYLWNKQADNITTQDRTNLQSGWHSVTVTDNRGCKAVKSTLLAFNDTINTGSYIINMGVTPQTIGNGLKPYGLVYDLVRNYKVPVRWVINPNKAKDGIDFSHNGVDYKGSAFIIEEEYLDNAIINRIAYWNSIGVAGAYTVSKFTVPVFGTITGFSNLGIDQANENLVIPYFNNAGIPSSIYYVGLPSNLDACEDAYVLPHADPTWANHRYLKDYVQTGGFLWTGCHAVSMIEGLANPSDANDKMNFLTQNGLQCYKGGKCGTVTEIHDGDHTAPTAYTATFDAHPIMQFMGDLVPTTNNGSERWYIPQSSGGWNPGVARAITTNNGSAGKEGVKLVFGRAFDNKENGIVMYQGGHTAHGKGTVAEQVAAERAFFNFILHSSVYNKLNAVATIPDTIGEGATVSVGVSVFDGTPPYTYEWSTNVSGSFTNSSSASTNFTLNAGNGRVHAKVSVRITDACGRNFFSTKAIVVQYIELTQTRISDYNGYNISCHGNSDGYIQLFVNGGTPPYTYNWSNGTTTKNVSGLAAGAYYLTITDALSGTLLDTFTLTQPTAISLSLSGTATLPCFYTATGSITSSVSGGVTPYAYNWSDGATTSNISNALPGEHTLAISDANGCYASTSHIIASPDSILLEITATNLSCYNNGSGAINLSATGGNGILTYAWNNGATTKNLSALQAGDYKVTVTDANSCTATIEDTITLTQPAALSFQAEYNALSCYGAADGTLEITVTGGVAPYMLHNLDGPYNAVPGLFTNLEGMDKWFWVVDASGCSTATQHIVINEPVAIGISYLVNHPLCKGDANGSIELNAINGVGALSYRWSNGSTNQNLENVTDGHYIVTVTDENGCSSVDSMDIFEIVSIENSFTVTDESSQGAADGSISQMVWGGDEPYSYSWSNGSNTKDITGLTPGNYSVTITDANGCTFTNSAIVSSNFTGKYWTGNISTAWNLADNWSPPGIPTSADTVIIPAGVVRMPIIEAGVTGACRFIDLKQGATLTMTSTSALDLHGDVYMNGSFVHGNGTVRFIGEAEQHYYSNKKINFYNLIMNNSSATGLQMYKSLTVNNTIAFNDGLIFTNNDTIFATNNSSGSITQHSDTSFVVGKFTRAISSNTNSYIFPLGRYVNGEKKQFHCEIVNNMLLGVNSITAYFDYWSPNEDKNIAFVDLLSDVVVDRMFDEGRWIVEPNAQPLAGSYSIKLYMQNFSQLEDNNFVILKRPLYGTKNDWTKGNGIFPERNSPGRRVADGYAKLIGLTSFSEFGGGGSGGGGLPIKLVDFTGRPQGDDIVLEWKTSVEINNDYFTVERSDNGSRFNIMGTVMGAGNSSIPLKYTWIDYEPLTGINYYRLKQTDFDGKFAYLKTIAISNIRPTSVLQVYNLFPNPNDGNFEIEFEAKHDKKAKIHIINSGGEVVRSYTQQYDKGVVKAMRYQLGEMLSSGIYTIVIEDGDERHYKKMTVVK
jgi:hypothetical protein